MGAPQIILGFFGFLFIGAFAWLWGEHRKARTNNDVVKENYTKLFRLWSLTAGLFTLGAAFESMGVGFLFTTPGAPLILYSIWYTYSYATKKCEGCARRVPKLKLVGRETRGQQHVSKTIERRIEHRSSNGTSTGYSTYDQTIQGVRTNFDEKWACQDCNHITTTHTYNDDYSKAS